MDQVWTEEKVEKEISGPMNSGVQVTALAKELGISRQRIYILLRKYGKPTRRSRRVKA
jgi:DNA-binding phage protein